MILENPDVSSTQKHDSNWFCFYTLCPILDAELYLIIPPFWGRMANNRFIFLEFFFFPDRFQDSLITWFSLYTCGHSLLVHLFIPPEMTKIWALSLALGLLPSSVRAQCLIPYGFFFILPQPHSALSTLAPVLHQANSCFRAFSLAISSRLQ